MSPKISAQLTTAYLLRTHTSSGFAVGAKVLHRTLHFTCHFFELTTANSFSPLSYLDSSIESLPSMAFSPLHASSPIDRSLHPRSRQTHSRQRQSHSTATSNQIIWKTDPSEIERTYVLGKQQTRSY